MRPIGEYKPIFPTPGGGMTIERIPEMLSLYGDDVMLLIGGDMIGSSPDLAANARKFLATMGR